jgi:hypothetical protein
VYATAVAPVTVDDADHDNAVNDVAVKGTVGVVPESTGPGTEPAVTVTTDDA